MYGKDVEVRLSVDAVIKVFVWCTPTTSQYELELRALESIQKLVAYRLTAAKLVEGK